MKYGTVDHVQTSDPTVPRTSVGRIDNALGGAPFRHGHISRAHHAFALAHEGIFYATIPNDQYATQVSGNVRVPQTSSSLSLGTWTAAQCDMTAGSASQMTVAQVPAHNSTTLHLANGGVSGAFELSCYSPEYMSQHADFTSRMSALTSTPTQPLQPSDVPFNDSTASSTFDDTLGSNSWSSHTSAYAHHSSGDSFVITRPPQSHASVQTLSHPEVQPISIDSTLRVTDQDCAPSLQNITSPSAAALERRSSQPVTTMMPALYSGQVGVSEHHSTAVPRETALLWPVFACTADMECDGEPVEPEIYARIGKGFFQSANDRKWTCYRRNYFSVDCEFDFLRLKNQGRIQVRHNGVMNLVRATGLCLAAAVDGSGGKTIDLVQYTAKRDAGDKAAIEIVRVAPLAGRQTSLMGSAHGAFRHNILPPHQLSVLSQPYLPLQNLGDASSRTNIQAHHASTSMPSVLSQSNHHHRFERIQFKQATANNGKRRASQQYFHLIVQLYGDIRKDGESTAVWVKLAQRVSEKIVVRGRSPSHYQNESELRPGTTGRDNNTGRPNAHGSASNPTYSISLSPLIRESVGNYHESFGGTTRFNAQISSGEHTFSPMSSCEGSVNTNSRTDIVPHRPVAWPDTSLQMGSISPPINSYPWRDSGHVISQPQYDIAFAEQEPIFIPAYATCFQNKNIPSTPSCWRKAGLGYGNEQIASAI